MSLKSFTKLQLLNITTGRLSTRMEDIYDILNHVTDSDLFTSQLPVALSYLKGKNPEWLANELIELFEVYKAHPNYEEEFFSLMDYYQSTFSEPVMIPQLKDEFDTSDFEDYMSNNSIFNLK